MSAFIPLIIMFIVLQVVGKLVGGNKTKQQAKIEEQKRKRAAYEAQKQQTRNREVVHNEPDRSLWKEEAIAQAEAERTQTARPQPRQQRSGQPRRAPANGPLTDLGDVIGQLQRDMGAGKQPTQPQPQMGAVCEEAEAERRERDRQRKRKEQLQAKQRQRQSQQQQPLRPQPQADAYAIKGESVQLRSREDLVRGIIMAEILGPPRSRKRSIR